MLDLSAIVPEPQTLTLESWNLALEPQTLMLDSQTLAVESQPLALDSQNLMHESQNLNLAQLIQSVPTSAKAKPAANRVVCINSSSGKIRLTIVYRSGEGEVMQIAISYQLFSDR
jgi:hypothetical protein